MQLQQLDFMSINIKYKRNTNNCRINQNPRDPYRLHTGQVVEEYCKRVEESTFLDKKIKSRIYYDT